MSLARAWTRQMYGAWGVGLLVPGTVPVALVLLGLANGPLSLASGSAATDSSQVAASAQAGAGTTSAAGGR